MYVSFVFYFAVSKCLRIQYKYRVSEVWYLGESLAKFRLINPFAIGLYPFRRKWALKKKQKLTKTFSEKLHFMKKKIFFFYLELILKIRIYWILSFWFSDSGEFTIPHILVKYTARSYRTHLIKKLTRQTDISKNFVRVGFVCLLSFAVNIRVRVCDIQRFTKYFSFN